MKIKIRLIDSVEASLPGRFKKGLKPKYMTKGAACADCFSFGDYSVRPKETTLIPLGFALELPEGYEAVIRPRSSLSKKGVNVAIGTIDCDYRGQVMACVTNNTTKEVDFYNGERVCQLKIQEAKQFELEETEELTDTERGAGGFGSTGK